MILYIIKVYKIRYCPPEIQRVLFTILYVFSLKSACRFLRYLTFIFHLCQLAGEDGNIFRLSEYSVESPYILKWEYSRFLRNNIKMYSNMVICIYYKPYQKYYLNSQGWNKKTICFKRIKKIFEISEIFRILNHITFTLHFLCLPQSLWNRKKTLLNHILRKKIVQQNLKIFHIHPCQLHFKSIFCMDFVELFSCVLGLLDFISTEICLIFRYLGISQKPSFPW